MKNSLFSQFFQLFSSIKTIKIILFLLIPLLYNIGNINDSEAGKAKTFLEEQRIKEEQEHTFSFMTKKIEENVARMNTSGQDFMKYYPEVSFEPAIKRYFPQFSDAANQILSLLQTISKEFEIPQKRIDKTKKITTEYLETFLTIIEKIGDDENLGSLEKKLRSKAEQLQREAAALKNISAVKRKEGKEEEEEEEEEKEGEKYKNSTFPALVTEIENNIDIMKKSEQGFIEKYPKMTYGPARLRFFPPFVKAQYNSYDLLGAISEKYASASEETSKIREGLHSYLQAFVEFSGAINRDNNIERLEKLRKEINLQENNLYQHIKVLKNSYNAQGERVFSAEEKKAIKEAKKRRLAQLIKETEESVNALWTISDTFIREGRKIGITKAIEKHLEPFFAAKANAYASLQELMEGYKTSKGEIDNTFHCIISYSGLFTTLTNSLKAGDATGERIQMLTDAIKKESAQCKKEVSLLKTANFVHKEEEKTQKKAKKIYTSEELEKKSAELKSEIKKYFIAMYNSMQMLLKEYPTAGIITVKACHLEKFLSANSEIYWKIEELDSLPSLPHQSDADKEEELMSVVVDISGIFVEIVKNLDEDGDKEKAREGLKELYKTVEEAEKITASAGVVIPQKVVDDLQAVIKKEVQQKGEN